jgi:hypothetical protein
MRAINNFCRLYIKMITFATLLQFKKLTVLRTYKIFIATCLLALYTFVATPATFLHSHGTAISSWPVKTSKEQKAFSKSTDQQSHIHCKVCSHQYDACSNVPGFLYISPKLALQSQIEWHTILNTSPTHLLLTGRGPPATT